ncbi:MAG: DUF5811 family protein [Haloarculaceae archaeon]
MYGNTSFGAGDGVESLTPEQRQRLRRDLASVAERTRQFLPGEFDVGSEITSTTGGPRATVAVRPPVGSPVSADYTPDAEEVGIGDDEREDIASGLAASAALQVKHAMADQDPPAAG